MYTVNQIPKQDVANSPTGCCPKFEPGEWDDETFRFEDKLFVKVSTRSFLHIPLNMSSVFKRTMAKIDAANASESGEYLILSDEVSPWRADHYIAVTEEVPGTKTARLSGTYYAKVFDGPYREARNWHRQMLSNVQARGIKPGKIYFFYTTCPKCAKTYGHNYVVGFARLLSRTV